MPYFAESNFDDIPEEFRLKSISNSGLQPISPEASAAQTGVENSGLQDAFSEDNPAIPRTKLQHRWSKPETETPSNYNPYGDRGLTGRQLQRIRASFEDDPLLCIEDDNARAQIEAVVARFGKDEGDQIKKAVALAHYYSMGHREKTGFIFDNLDAAIEEFEGKPMSVEQAYESIRNIYNPKQEGFYGNPGVAAVTAGGAEIWKSMINTEGFVGKRVIQGAQIAGITGVGLYSAVLRLIGAEGKAERVWESGKDMLLGRDYGQEFEDMTQRDAKTFQTIETWAQQNMNVPSDWVTNSESVADWTANATLSFINYVPQLAAQTGLMTATGGVSALATVFGINGYYDIKGDLPDISEGEALLYGIGVAGVNSLLEKVSFGIIEGKLAEKVASTGIKKGLIRALAYLGASQGLEGAEEGLEEFAENILDIGFGRRGNTKEWTAKDWAGNLLQGVPEAVFLGFTSGLPMAAPHLGDLRARAEYNERIKQFVGKRKAELDAKGELTPEEETEASVLSAAMDSNRPEQVERAAQTVVMNAKLRRKQEQDTAKKRYDEAEARLNKAQAELDTISDRTGQNAANRNTAVMKQRAAQTELDEARAELEAARRDYVKAFPEEETDAERAKREAEEIRTKRDLKRRIGWNPQDTIDKVNELAQQYTAIPIHAVQTFDDLPEAARLEAEARGLDKSKANAVWSNGEVYVIADKTRPSDTEKRILHEVVGHEGLRRVFGKDFDAFLDDVFALHSKEIEEMGLSALYNTKPDTEEGRRYLADEFLAKMAEQDVKPSWWKELLAQIRAYLRKVAPKLHFSDAEIEAALVRSARAMREQKRFSDAPESRFAAALRREGNPNHAGETGKIVIGSIEAAPGFMEWAGLSGNGIYVDAEMLAGKHPEYFQNQVEAVSAVAFVLAAPEKANDVSGNLAFVRYDEESGRYFRVEIGKRVVGKRNQVRSVHELNQAQYEKAKAGIDSPVLQLSQTGYNEVVQPARSYSDFMEYYSTKYPNVKFSFGNFDDVRFALGGEIGAGRMSDSEIKERNRQTAIEMEEAGKDEKTIWLATGWNRGTDRNWKFELPDAKVKLGVLNSRELTETNGWYLYDFVEAKELFEAYPELKDIIVRIENLEPGTAGYYDPRVDEIVLNRLGSFDAMLGELGSKEDAAANAGFAMDRESANKRLSDFRKGFADMLNKTMVHEIQHAIQHIEGFAKGTSPEAAAQINRNDLDPAYRYWWDYKQKYTQRLANLSAVAWQMKELSDSDIDVSNLLKEAQKIIEDKASLPMYGDQQEHDDALSLAEEDVENAMYELLARYAPDDPSGEFVDIARDLLRLKNTTNVIEENMTAFKTYQRFTGEVESRNVEDRMKMSDKDRRETPPSETEDYPRSYQIVRFSVSPVWTGSAADYEKPDLHYVGTGEGAQVYGWGLYGSSERGVGETYANADVENKKSADVLWDGKPSDVFFREMRGNTNNYRNKSDDYWHLTALNDILKDNQGDVDRAKKSVQKSLDLAEEYNRPKEELDGLRRRLQILEEYRDRIKFRPAANKTLTINGEKIVYGQSDPEKSDWEKVMFNFLFSAEGDRQKALRDVNESIRIYKYRVQSGEDFQNELSDMERIKEFLSDKNNRIVYGDGVIGRRNLYKQTFWPGKEENLLDWDETLSEEQAAKILDEFEAEHTDKDIIDWINSQRWVDATQDGNIDFEDEEYYAPDVARDYMERYTDFFETKGMDVYQQISSIFHSPKKASEFLYRAGIDGITYIGDDSGVRNYVAFSDKDIRVDEHIRFSVGGTDENLIVVHNVSEQKLRDAIKLGALPVPSIGIIDAEKSNFTDYGAITLIGDRDLIDPKNKKNKVFDSDVYSPTRPNIQRLYTDEEYDRALEVMEKYDQPSEIHDPLKRIVENHKYNYDDSDFESDLKNSVAAKNWYSQTKQDDEDFESWWQRVAAPELNLHPTGRIFDGFTNSGRRRYLPANLETIVKLMTRKVRDAEGFFYGFGNVRSNVSKQFKSIAEIQKSRDKIVSNEDYKTIKKEVQEEYYALLDDIEHAIVGGRVARSREAAEDLLRAMAEGTRKQQNREWLEMALGRENPIYQDMADFLTKLKNMPTRIFEAKPQRAVYLDEFRAAVVPEGTSRDILNALEQAGVDVFTYANEEARRATLQMVTKEKNLRFSLDNMSEEDKSDLVKLLKPKWNEEAFVEPSEVKAYLESIGETGVDENEAWSLYQMAGAAIRADNKRAKERARDKWIEQNYDLIAKVSEFTSNRGLLDFVIRPSFRFKDNDEWPGTFIAEAWRKKGKKPKQFALESDLHYRERLRKRDEALEHADGKASDELAQEIADKYGGDPLDIEEKLIETFRYLKKTDLYRAYSKYMSEQNYRTRQENEIAEAEYAEYKREQIEQTVADMLENGKQITEEWAMANPEVFAELYRQLMHSEPPKSKKPSRENLEAMNAALANKDINAETYKAAKRAAVAEYQKKLTALRQEMNDRNVNAMKLQRDAAAFAEEHLPEELRGDFTRGIIKLLEYGTSPSKNYPEGKRMAEFYKLQSAMLNAAQSKRTQDSIGHINEMLDAVKVKRNWKGIPVSVIPSEQARVERIRKIVNMSAASVANAIEYNNEKILELEDQSNKDFADGKVNTDTGAELQKLKDDNALLELFGNLAYRKPDSVTKAEEFLESLIRGGKAKFKSLLAEQAGRVLEMRQQAVNQITGGRNIVPENKDAKNHTPYILKNMNLGSLMHLVAAKAGVDFDSSVFGKLWRNVEDSTQKEMTSNRRLQEDFDKELEAECGITGNALEKMRKKGRFLKDAGKVVEHTGVFKIQYSRQKVIDPFDNPILQEGRSSSKVHLIPVEDYTRRVRQEDGSFEEVQCPGVRSIIRAIDNGESIEFDGVPLDETGIWFLRKQLDDYDAGIDRRLDFFVDEIDAESAEKLKADSEKDKLAVISRGKNVEEKRVEVPLSQGTALQILLTWEQEDFRPNMKWNGWSEESIEQIKKFLKSETLKLGYWMRDYFAKQRGELDAAVVKRYGAHLPENTNYWPGRFSGSRTSIGTGGMRGAGTMSINPSFLIARKFHLNPLDMEMDAFSVFFDGQIKQDHFLAWTDAIRDLREVIGNTDVQNAINDNFGKDVTKNLVERIVTIAQGGTENGGFISSLFSRLNRHWIPAKIALNPSSFIKQILGSMAYLNNIPVRDYVKYMSRANFTNADYRAFAEMALKSDYLKNRMSGGLDKDLIYLMQNTRDTVPYSPFADSLISGSTFLTKRADRWSALHGGFAIYQYTLDQARKSGLTEKDAQERARRAWMRATDETQQSGYLKDLNYFQQNQGLVRFYTAFLSNPIQVMNLELQTLNEIKYDPKNEAAKKRLVKQLFVNHLIVPTLMQFTTDMVRAGFSPSEWWDDSEFEDYFIAWLFGPFEGLFILGKEGMSLLNWLGNKTLGRKGVTTQPTSAVQILDEGKQNANRFWNDIKDGEITQKDIADGLSIAGDIGMIYGALPLPGAAEAGSAGTVTNASGTLYKRILKIAGEDEEKSGKSGKKKKRR